MKPYNEIVHTMKVNGAKNNTGHFPFLRTWSGTITLSPWWKRPSRGYTFFASWGSSACDTVLLCHYWIHPPHVNNCLVQLSYQIWPQKTTEGCPDCWENNGVVPNDSLTKWSPNDSPPLSKICTYPEWAKGLVKSLWTPHIQHTPSLTYFPLVDATELWAPERPDTETVSFPKQSISWTLDTKCGTHNTFIQLFIHHAHLLFFISNVHMSDLYTHNCLYCILCFCHFENCLFVYCSFVVCILSRHCHSVALWSFCHYNKFLVCVNIHVPGQ